MEALTTLMNLLDTAFWAASIAFAGLIVSALVYVFSKGKNERIRENSKWCAVGFMVIVAIVIIAVGVISEQIDSVTEGIISEAEMLVEGNEDG